ncbi:transposase domain-containing protein, partial [Vibrio cholerae]|uniref:transposase domain-containing protein n=1 Tax=Vibrio cholerae TaxID=666 RepID=UPI003A102F22
MFLRQTLDRIHQFSADQLNGLSDLLCPELINQCLEDTGVATLRKRRLPMELMVWSIVGMSLYRHLSMSKVVSQLDILLPGKKPFVALSDLLCPELINQCLEDTGVATLRKRRLPMELMVWSIVGMSLYRHLSMSKVVSQLD